MRIGTAAARGFVEVVSPKPALASEQGVIRFIDSRSMKFSDPTLTFPESRKQTGEEPWTSLNGRNMGRGGPFGGGVRHVSANSPTGGLEAGQSSADRRILPGEAP